MNSGPTLANQGRRNVNIARNLITKKRNVFGTLITQKIN
jgi:hypothetical protein